jgi:hypothetical protein
LSPILVRPVREQLEHDRIIRQLQAKFRRKYEVGINPGGEQNTAVTGAGPGPMYPDVVLLSPDRGHKLQGVIEVETGESVNHLEALAEWAHFSKARAPFHLYVPGGMVDVARRLCEDNHIYVSEIWSYHAVGDQVRFTMVFRNKEAPPVPSRVKAPHPALPRPSAPRSGGSRAASPRSAAPPKRKAAPRATKAKRAKASVKGKRK